jgi:hypothetical protein
MTRPTTIAAYRDWLTTLDDEGLREELAQARGQATDTFLALATARRDAEQAANWLREAHIEQASRLEERDPPF